MKRLISLSVFLFMTSISFVTQASDTSGPYLKGSVGHTIYSTNNDDIVLGPTTYFFKKNQGLSGRVSLGYQINDFLGFEAAYNQLGKQFIEFSDSSPTTPNDNDRNNTLTLKGFELDVVGTLPLKMVSSTLNGFDVHANAGVAKLTNRSVEKNAFENGSLQNFDNSVKKSVFAWGVGTSYRFNDYVSAGLDLNSFQRVSGGNNGIAIKPTFFAANLKISLPVSRGYSSEAVSSTPTDVASVSTPEPVFTPPVMPVAPVRVVNPIPQEGGVVTLSKSIPLFARPLLNADILRTVVAGSVVNITRKISNEDGVFWYVTCDCKAEGWALDNDLQ